MTLEVKFRGADAHPDHLYYLHFTGPARLQKSINSLLGIVAGIAVDAVINERELSYLQIWLDEHRELEGTHPYNELVPVVSAAIADKLITEDEKEDILWLCEKLRSADFFDVATADMQRLHAMLGGIAADGEITELELKGLQRWLDEHQHLCTRWPYDEVDGLITHVLADRRIDRAEHIQLMSFFQEFTALLDDRTITNPHMTDNGTIVGICAACPEIAIEGSTFAFTGASHRYTRTKFSEVVTDSGGTVLSGVSAKLDYLIIGAAGNPCWAYACYGRKVERAVELRREGHRLMLIHENDFHDALEDA